MTTPTCPYCGGYVPILTDNGLVGWCETCRKWRDCEKRKLDGEDE